VIEEFHFDERTNLERQKSKKAGKRKKREKAGTDEKFIILRIRFLVPFRASPFREVCVLSAGVRMA
jgi:hypothetical protein